MKPVILATPGDADIAQMISGCLDAADGRLCMRQFPDGEWYVRIDTPVEGRDVVIVCSMNPAADKVLPLMFLAATARDLGARRIGLVAPYLAFMRQDHRFYPGEGVTSVYFARMLSDAVDWLITVDPHLHRWSSLDQIYTVPSRIVRAAPSIAAWVRDNVEHPVLIGPDDESQQWVAAVAEAAGAPYLILEKLRHGDREVEVSAPAVEGLRDHTPVLVDDIISTGHTMIATLEHLKGAGMAAPICVGIHAVFAKTAYDELLAAGARQVVSCNTVAHASNAIDVCPALAAAVTELVTADPA